MNIYVPAARKNDLSNPIDESIPTWPTFERVQCEQTDWAARDGFTMERVDMASHTATRVDSPLHFIPKGKTLDDFSSDEFMREGVILNLSQRDNQITIDESKLREFDAEIQANDVVMLHTRWEPILRPHAGVSLRVPPISRAIHHSTWPSRL